MPLEIEGNYLSRCTPDPAASEITVPEGVKTIGYRAFANCPQLRSLILPVSLRQIEDHALDQCGQLAALTIPQRVSLIGVSAFHRHTALTFRTGSVSLLVPPRSSYTESGDAAVLANILHLRSETEIPMLFPSLHSFEFRAAAAVWLMQNAKPKCAANWFRQNTEHMLEMYLDLGSTDMLHLMLQTDAVPEELLGNTITRAIEKGDHEVYMMLVNHKQGAFGITEGSGTFRL
ncbi:MAG: leucine-rich repeat domain-containing protein [Oscillospiraceae bacterium]|nr:leucine-rich repeat domain-containing protein [Oscillospiraceae bacterium]